MRLRGCLFCIEVTLVGLREGKEYLPSNLGTLSYGVHHSVRLLVPSPEYSVVVRTESHSYSILAGWVAVDLDSRSDYGTNGGTGWLVDEEEVMFLLCFGLGSTSSPCFYKRSPWCGLRLKYDSYEHYFIEG